MQYPFKTVGKTFVNFYVVLHIVYMWLYYRLMCGKCIDSIRKKITVNYKVNGSVIA